MSVIGRGSAVTLPGMEYYGVARYGEDLYLITRAKVTPSGWILAIPSGGDGDHTSYPPDGRVHDTLPRGEPCRVFRDKGPPLSEVTCQHFADFDVPSLSSGPPSNASRIEQSPANALVVDAPQVGVGYFAVMAVNPAYEPQVLEAWASETSGTTCALGRKDDKSFLLAYDPTGKALGP